MRQVLLLLLLIGFATSFTGCTLAGWERSSDRQLQQYDPGYQPLHPDLRGRSEWGW